MLSGPHPSRSACANTIGLNALPGCRFACTARLKLLSAKERPPTTARIAPFCGSTATSAPCRYRVVAPRSAGESPRISTPRERR